MEVTKEALAKVCSVRKSSVSYLVNFMTLQRFYKTIVAATCCNTSNVSIVTKTSLSTVHSLLHVGRCQATVAVLLRIYEAVA
jgi:hypothetical protein